MVTVSKKRLTMLIAALMIAVVAVGATLAWLSNKTNTEVNHISMIKPEDGVDGVIKEEGWEDDKNKPAYPNFEFNKKVMVENKSELDTDIWVAVKMSITKGTADADKKTTPLASGDLEKIVAIMSPMYNDSITPWYNEDKWERESSATSIQEHEIFYLKAKLPKGETSPQIFDKIKILESASPEQMEAVRALEGEGFNIVMSGAVLQATDTQTNLDDTIRTQLKDLLKYGE